MGGELTNYCGKKKDPAIDSQSLVRADDGIRTRDPQLGKLMLYQLSYVRIERKRF